MNQSKDTASAAQETRTHERSCRKSRQTPSRGARQEASEQQHEAQEERQMAWPFRCALRATADLAAATFDNQVAVS